MVTAHALSSLDRVARLLDGLSEDLRRKVVRHCTKQGWKLSTQDSGTADPEYDAIKSFILTEAQTNQTMAVYDSERSLRERTSTSISDALRQDTSGKASAPTPTLSPMPASTEASSAPSVDPGIAELTKQFAQLTLLLQANLNQPRGPSTPGGVPRTFGDRQPRCLWCDATDHLRKFCPSFMETLKSGKIRFNDEFHLTNAATGVELPLNFGRGGQEAIFRQQQASTIPLTSPNVNAITLEPQYATLGTENSVMLTIINDDGTAEHQIIDVDVEEKRKRDDHGQQGRRVRFRDDETPTPSPRPAPYVAPIPPVPAPGSSSRRDPEPTDTGRRPAGPAQQKYRLASELTDTVPIATIGEKLMDTPVTLNLREVFAASSEISTYIHDQTRKRRKLIDPDLEAMVTSTEPAPATVSPIIQVNSATMAPLYACASGRAKAVVNGGLKVDSLLDDGSEVNLMPWRTFEQLDLPIDKDISWRISTFNTGSETEAHGCLGVCHSVPIDIGGVEVKVPVFIMSDSNQDLLLGRPWARMARANFNNEDDGSYTCRIKSPDGRRIVQFCAAKADNPRNRSFARDADGSFPTEHLKV